MYGRAFKHARALAYGALAHTHACMQVVIVQYEMVMSKPDMGMLKSLSWSYMVVDEVCLGSAPAKRPCLQVLQRERVGGEGEQER